jgi:hypothetical protein
MSFLSKKLTGFYKTLKPPAGLPPGVEVLHPQADREVMKIVTRFYKEFYSNDHPRTIILGINPGRHGAGITGINFTGPRQLKEFCGIEHSFGNSSELSAEFIYAVINAYGGVKKFYSDYVISAISPLGYTLNGKNLNYYDDRKLQLALTPFINDCLSEQLSYGIRTDHCICIGGEKNYKFLQKLNDERAGKGHSHFEKITPLPHPRFILQYRRKQLDKYVNQYLAVLSQ